MVWPCLIGVVLYALAGLGWFEAIDNDSDSLAGSIIWAALWPLTALIAVGFRIYTVAIRHHRRREIGQ